MKIRHVVLALAGVAFSSSVYAQGFWVRSNDGYIPNRAWTVGRDTNGSALYLCRSRFNGGVHPGKLRNDFNGCHISYGGREITRPNYEVLVGRPGGWWKFARDGELSARATPVGYDSNNQELFLCRTNFNGSMQPGKIRPGFRGCNFAYNGQEIVSTRYFVFVNSGPVIREGGPIIRERGPVIRGPVIRSGPVIRERRPVIIDDDTQ